MMVRVGRGTGIRAPRLKAAARKLMPQCQAAVPVWIMPLSTVAETFDPSTAHFDVVIIDEASQADVMALVPLYMADQVLIVGDHEQVTPDDIGQRLEEVQSLIDQYLQGIPNADLYDGQTSIYDIAMTSFHRAQVPLREHFRCVEPIITFSNYLSYNGEILPLRDSGTVIRKPPTIAYRVDGLRSGHVNEEEALTIATLLTACMEQPEYDDATFGVISLLGNEQWQRVEQLLRRHLTPAQYRERQIRCGNSAHFQGGERDVMFLSVVDSPNPDGPLTRRTAGPRNIFKKRFNVAASRAKDQMWVVHSLDPDIDLQSDDLRHRLILHAQDPEAVPRQLEREVPHTRSTFEVRVMEKLMAAGYKVKAAWKAGAYEIDLVVEGGGNKKLAIECDGDRYHPPEQLAADYARERVLERAGGWQFERIRGTSFIRDPERAMKPVFERLDALGILPEGADNDAYEEDADAEALKKRVVRRAMELRQEWTSTSVSAGEESRPAAMPREGRADGRREVRSPVVHTQETAAESGPITVLQENQPRSQNEAKSSAVQGPRVRRTKSRREQQDDDRGKPAQKTQVPPRREPLTCPFCGKKFRTPGGKSWHLVNIHRIDDDNAGGKSAPKRRSDSLKLEQSDVYEYTPDFFFGIAGNAKKQGKLESRERRFMYSMGSYRARGWLITERQERQAHRIIQKAVELGLVGADERTGNRAGRDDEEKHQQEKASKLPQDFLHRAKGLRNEGHNLDTIGRLFGLSAQEVQEEMDRRQQEIDETLAEIFPHDDATES